MLFDGFAFQAHLPGGCGRIVTHALDMLAGFIVAMLESRRQAPYNLHLRIFQLRRSDRNCLFQRIPVVEIIASEKLTFQSAHTPSVSLVSQNVITLQLSVVRVVFLS
jgi:hypothetical protein